MSRPTQHTFTCQFCGKAFTVAGRLVCKARPRLFCNRECWKQFRFSIRAGSAFTCEICGKLFYRNPSQILNGSIKTCSVKCMGKMLSGQGNPFWSSIDPSQRPPKERKRRNLTKKGWKDSKCAYCGATANLETDHIIPVFDGGPDETVNIQTLCKTCNHWKTFHVDLPRYRARLALQRT